MSHNFRSELGVITITALLRRCIQAVTSPQLLQGGFIFDHILVGTVHCNHLLNND